MASAVKSHQFSSCILSMFRLFLSVYDTPSLACRVL